MPLTAAYTEICTLEFGQKMIVASVLPVEFTCFLIYVQDKILQSTGRGRSVTVTNDGATILKSLHIDNPAAKVLVGILLFGYIALLDDFTA